MLFLSASTNFENLITHINEKKQYRTNIMSVIISYILVFILLFGSINLDNKLKSLKITLLSLAIFTLFCTTVIIFRNDYRQFQENKKIVMIVNDHYNLCRNIEDIYAQKTSNDRNYLDILGEVINYTPTMNADLVQYLNNRVMLAKHLLYSKNIKSPGVKYSNLLINELNNYMQITSEEQTINNLHHLMTNISTICAEDNAINLSALFSYIRNYNNSISETIQYIDKVVLLSNLTSKISDQYSSNLSGLFGAIEQKIVPILQQIQELDVNYKINSSWLNKTIKILNNQILPLNITLTPWQQQLQNNINIDKIIASLPVANISSEYKYNILNNHTNPSTIQTKNLSQTSGYSVDKHQIYINNILNGINVILNSNFNVNQQINKNFNNVMKNIFAFLSSCSNYYTLRNSYSSAINPLYPVESVNLGNNLEILPLLFKNILTGMHKIQSTQYAPGKYFKVSLDNINGFTLFFDASNKHDDTIVNSIAQRFKPNTTKIYNNMQSYQSMIDNIN